MYGVLKLDLWVEVPFLPKVPNLEAGDKEGPQEALLSPQGYLTPRSCGAWQQWHGVR